MIVAGYIIRRTIILAAHMVKEGKIKMPVLKGLVLAGGDSARMGVDKGLIDYHGMPQQDYLVQLLAPFTVQTYISKRSNQFAEDNQNVIRDVYTDLGPFGGILSAFQSDPECAWFVIACDFPLVNSEAIAQLIDARRDTSYAVSFLDERALMPEPWISILEPKIYPILLDYLKRGRSSLRGILVDYNTPLIRIKNKDVLLNANTPEESEKLRQIIQGR